MIFELALWGRNEEDLVSGHKRIKEGDIVAVKEYPATWGPRALMCCIIVILDGIPSKEDAHLLKIPHYTNGGFFPPQVGRPEVNSKKRFVINLLDLKVIYDELDFDKVRDNSYAYQPFKKKSQTEQGCNNQVVVDGGSYPETEVIVDTISHICFDKYNNDYINLTLPIIGS